MIAVIIPCFRTSQQILGVLERVPDIADLIVVIDDACPEQSGAIVTSQCKDSRVHVIRNDVNQGVGGAVLAGFRVAISKGATILVKVDGDGQIDPALIPQLIAPIQSGRADYSKGNRFFSMENLEGMPKARLIGNAGLSFLTKLSSGYWSIMDPTNAFIAIHRQVLELIPLVKLDQRYFFESDLLFRLSTVRAAVIDVPMQARYENENSSLSLTHSFFLFSTLHIRRFFKRLAYNYFVRNFNPASLMVLFGTTLFLFGTIFGAAHWVNALSTGIPTTAGTVMLSALPMVLGFQMLLSALQYDIESEPKQAIYPLLGLDEANSSSGGNITYPKI